jgi:hypothetical protein
MLIVLFVFVIVFAFDAMDRHGVFLDDDDDDDDSGDDLMDEIEAMRVVRRHAIEFVLGVHCRIFLHGYFSLWRLFYPYFRECRLTCRFQ